MKQWVEDSFDVYLTVPSTANHMLWAMYDPMNYAPSPFSNASFELPNRFHAGRFEGFTGYEEVEIYGTDPTNKSADADKDGLLDTEEIFGTYGYVSDPHNPNSDYEGFTDIEEVKAAYGYKTDPWEADTDADYIEDYKEILGEGTYGKPGYKTSPLNPDTDGDGLIDGVEVEGWTAY